MSHRGLPLHAACQFGHLSCVELILRSGTTRDRDLARAPYMHVHTCTGTRLAHAHMHMRMHMRMYMRMHIYMYKYMLHYIYRFSACRRAYIHIQTCCAHTARPHHTRTGGATPKGMG